MCAIDDCEPWDVYRQESRKARKAHACTECGRTIYPGEDYVFSTGLADGHWSRCTTCRHSTAAGSWLHVMCSGYPMTMLGDELHEHCGAFDSELLIQLYESFRARWRDGQAPAPLISTVEADANRCLGALTV